MNQSKDCYPELTRLRCLQHVLTVTEHGVDCRPMQIERLTEHEAFRDQQVVHAATHTLSLFHCSVHGVDDPWGFGLDSPSRVMFKLLLTAMYS
ncbi:hypothetical protein RRG08_066562 [Elysia crispata]|uniref:Uncharacterized protein n=1 Tax=Elysia crispata TaxID=231223 RepID=A0AAE1CJU9_9GAST|nr:hypothetical protein RRG08_066562 [Elysia crispata]